MTFKTFDPAKRKFYDYAAIVAASLFLTVVKTVEICIWVGGSIYFWREVLMPGLSEGRTFWIVIPLLFFAVNLFQLIKKRFPG